MAPRLEKWLGADRGGSADAWLAQQAVYDLWQARKAEAPKISKIRRYREAHENEHIVAKK